MTAKAYVQRGRSATWYILFWGCLRRQVAALLPSRKKSLAWRSSTLKYINYIPTFLQLRISAALWLMNGYTVNETPCLKHQSGLKFAPGLKCNSYIHFIAKYVWKKCPLPCTAPENTQLLLPRARSKQKWTITDIYGLEITNPHFPALTDFKSLCTAFWVMNCVSH